VPIIIQSPRLLSKLQGGYIWKDHFPSARSSLVIEPYDIESFRKLVRGCARGPRCNTPTLLRHNLSKVRFFLLRSSQNIQIHEVSSTFGYD
jgi:hypothetical protein